jgi:hypothetical protein
MARPVDLSMVRHQGGDQGGPGLEALRELGMAKPESGKAKSAGEGCACLASKWLL